MDRVDINSGNEIFSEALGNELITSNKSLIIDLAEIDLDLIVDNPVLKEIPIVKTLLSFGKMGLFIRDKYFVKKLLAFLQEYNSGSISEEKRIEFRNQMKDSSYKTKVTEFLMTFIDRYTNITKAELTARLLVSYINGLYDWDMYVYFVECLNTMFPGDLKKLKLYYNYYEMDIKTDKGSGELDREYGSIERLVFIGFLNTYFNYDGQDLNIAKMSYGITDRGRLFYESIKI